MINGTDMANVKMSLRRIYFIDGRLGGMTDEEAAKYSANMMQCIEDSTKEQGDRGITYVMDYVTDRIMTNIRKSQANP